MKSYLTLILALAMLCVPSAHSANDKPLDMSVHINGKVHNINSNDQVWFDRKGDIHSEKDFELLLTKHSKLLEERGCPNIELEELGPERSRTLYLPNSSFSNHGISLENRDLRCAHFDNSNFQGMSFRGSIMHRAELSKANVSLADFKGVDLSVANLAKANLQKSNMQDVNLSGSYLDGAIFDKTDLKNAVYEPISHPIIGSIASAKNLGHLKYQDNPQKLYELKLEFRKRGYISAEKQITAALWRHSASFGEYLLFDLTSEYGANWKRPLFVVFILFCAFSFLYAFLFYFDKTSQRSVFLAVRRRPGHRGLHYGERIYSRKIDLIPPSTHLDYLVRLKRYLFLIYISCLLSMLSATRLGYRDLDFGKWIRLIQRREHDIYLKGKVRLLTGIQSIVSLYFLGLSVVCFFGQPFEY